MRRPQFSLRTMFWWTLIAAMIGTVCLIVRLRLYDHSTQIRWDKSGYGSGRFPD